MNAVKPDFTIPDLIGNTGKMLHHNKYPNLKHEDSKEFNLHNPKASHTCGCGEIFSM